MSTQPSQPKRTFGAEDSLPCIKCGKGWMHVVRRNHVDDKTERQILLCNECTHELTRTIGSNGIEME